MPKYTQQIVVFLDILGFSNMLPAFEEEALNHDIQADDDYHESPSLNKLIDIFKDSIELIKNAECNYYLFSDNICITIDYIDNGSENPDLFIDILTLISLLMKEFVQEGYFLRGGVDAGWFVDSRDIAVGQPLSIAYTIESKKAIHPRIVLSDNFLSILQDYIAKDQLNDHSMFLADKYLKRDEEFSFLNPFFYIVNFEEKESKIEYLSIYSAHITKKLKLFENDEKIGPKYKWFTKEFNSFVDAYLKDQAYLEIDSDELQYSLEEIEMIKKFKI